MQQYKKINLKKQQKIFEKAKSINEVFLGTNAVIEVNFPNHVINTVKQKLSEFDSKTNPLAKDLFEQCETEVMKNLTDMYTRFFKSKIFSDYLQKL